MRQPFFKNLEKLPVFVYVCNIHFGKLPVARAAAGGKYIAGRRRYEGLASEINVAGIVTVIYRHGKEHIFYRMGAYHRPVEVHTGARPLAADKQRLYSLQGI